MKKESKIRKLTKKDAIRLFRKDWKYKAKTGQADKCCPPEVVENWDMLHLVNKCFPCEYDITHKGCYCLEKCLIKWPGNYCYHNNSPYSKWQEAKTSEERKQYAKIIAELPERK